MNLVLAGITVFCAASAGDAMERSVQRYRGGTVRVSSAASGLLARQIERGAPADIFLSADRRWVDRLEGLKLVAQRRPYLRTGLVIIRPRRAATVPLNDIKGCWVSADPAVAPLGVYAEEALRTLRLPPSSARLIPAASAAAALQVIVAGRCAAGVVYRHQARHSGVTIAASIPVAAHKEIIYELVLLKRADRGAVAVFDYLFGGAGRAPFSAIGLAPVL